MTERAEAADEFLDRVFWGYSDAGGSEWYRRALPPTSAFPRASRLGQWAIDRNLTVPPYVLARETDGAVNVMLCTGSGVRANTAGVTDWSRIDDLRSDQYICAGRDNVPPEWLEPIGVALAEIREHFPGRPLRFEPDDPDTHTQGEP